MCYNEAMEQELKRPERKTADVKVTDADMIYFSLGQKEGSAFVLPSERKDYRSDERSVRLIEAVRSGKTLSGCDFSGLNLKGADLSGGLFDGCNFKGAVFYKTKAQNADFSNCCFDEAYFEDSDLSGCDFSGATFKRTFFKHNKTEKAFFDEEAEKYLTELEKIIRLIESGELDIRTLSKEDLICLDVRRLDFSKVDLTDIDLSVFALDGINLCGTYIDPKQLMSLSGWNSYCLDVRKTKEKTRERLCRKIMLDREEALEKYRQEQVKNKKKKGAPTKNSRRPLKKEPEREENRAWGLQKFHKEQAQKEAERQKKLQEEPEQKQASSKAKILTENQALKENFETKEQKPVPDKQTGEQISDKKAPLSILQSRAQAESQAGNQSVEQAPKQVILQTKPKNETSLSNKKETLDFAKHSFFERQAFENNSADFNKKEMPVSVRQMPTAAEPKVISLNRSSENVPQMIVSHTEAQEKKAEIKVTAEMAKNAYYAEQERLKREAELEKREEEMRSAYEETASQRAKPAKPVKPTDDEETVRDLTNAGYTIEEISQIVREKGPMRVIGKAQNMRPVKGKTKG